MILPKITDSGQEEVITPVQKFQSQNSVAIFSLTENMKWKQSYFQKNLYSFVLNTWAPSDMPANPTSSRNKTNDENDRYRIHLQHMTSRRDELSKQKIASLNNTGLRALTTCSWKSGYNLGSYLSVSVSGFGHSGIHPAEDHVSTSMYHWTKFAYKWTQQFKPMCYLRVNQNETITL